MARKNTTAGDAFLQAICAEPDEDVHRLVYADWLDENGDPERAEFIRVQCTLAKMGTADPQRSRLARRQQALYEAHHRAWFDELPEFARPRGYGLFTFHRGFVADISCTARQWLKGVEKLLPKVPPERVRLYRCKGVVAEVSRSPHLANLSAIQLHEFDGPREIGELAAATHLKRLSNLDLSRNDLDDASMSEFVKLPFLTRVTRLNLSLNDIGDAGTKALAATKALAGVVDLDLSFNELATAGAEALAASPHLACLRELDLGNNHFGTDGVRALAGSRTLTGLTALRFRAMNIRSESLAALARSPMIENLLHLGMPMCGIGPEGVEALAAVKTTPLRYVDLLENEIGDRGASALARSAICATLVDLNLYHNGIGPAGTVALASSPHLGNLQSLRLNGTSIGDEGGLALARSPHLKSLTQVNVSAEGLSEKT